MEHQRDILKRIKEIFDSGQFTNSSMNGGKYVQLFERELSTYLKRPTVAVSSGTSALILSLWAAGVRAGDEVIIPAYSFRATKNAVLALQAKPVYADISLDNYCILAREIDEKVTDRTKAIIIVDLYGNISPIRFIDDIPVIEDACQALGTIKKIRADYTCFSFYPTKIVNTMEGGAVTCRDFDATNIKDLRNHGFLMGFGFNMRMNEISALMGYVQMLNFIPRPPEIKHYDYTLSPRGLCPNADSLV